MSIVPEISVTYIPNVTEAPTEATLPQRQAMWLAMLRSWCAVHAEFVCAPDIIPTSDLIELRCAGLIDVALRGERLHVWPVGGIQ